LKAFLLPLARYASVGSKHGVTEGAPKGDAREVEGLKRGLGHQVFKLDQSGNVVMTLGEAGVSGYGPKHFNGPSGALVTPSGDIWVTDGHRGGNNRIVKFSKDGTFLLEVGGGVDSKSGDPGKFNDPHDLTMDSSGRILVAGRLLEGLLFGVGASDPLTLAIVPLVLAAMALLASFFPARRATSIDPAVVLRQE